MATQTEVEEEASDGDRVALDARDRENRKGWHRTLISLILMLVTGFVGGTVTTVLVSSNATPSIHHLTSYQVAVAQIDPGADMSKYPGISNGGFIVVKVWDDDFWKLQNNATDQTICLPGHVALSALVTQQNMASTACGAAIHVVLLEPR